MKNKPKTIYCPLCNRKVGTYDGRSTINRVIKCQKCDRLVVYDIESKGVFIKEVPPRHCSSGSRFY